MICDPNYTLIIARTPTVVVTQLPAQWSTIMPVPTQWPAAAVGPRYQPQGPLLPQQGQGPLPQAPLLPQQFGGLLPQAPHIPCQGPPTTPTPLISQQSQGPQPQAPPLPQQVQGPQPQVPHIPQQGPPTTPTPLLPPPAPIISLTQNEASTHLPLAEKEKRIKAWIDSAKEEKKERKINRDEFFDSDTE